MNEIRLNVGECEFILRVLKDYKQNNPLTTRSLEASGFFTVGALNKKIESVLGVESKRQKKIAAFKIARARE